MKVLHIEDQRENRLLVRKVLEAKGHTVEDATDGLLGLEIARRSPPDMVLVDINIPGLNGYEVVTRLRAEEFLLATPIIAITAEGDREHALALGFDGFIAKPIRAGSFASQLEAFYAGHRETVPDSCRADHLLEHSRQVVDRLESRVRELERANARLREVDRLKMDVLRNVSHELSTPMTPLIGYVRLWANGELGAVSTDQGRVLGRMEHSLGRLKGQIDNLLNATRFATGQSALEHEVVDARPLVTEAIAAVRKRIGSEATVEFEAGDIEKVVIDRVRFADAVQHIVENALKFGPREGPVHVRSWIEVVGDGDRRILVVSVTDLGPGIPSDQRDQVCEPFYQCDGSTTRSHGGAGLGLAIARRSAVAHGGSLAISEADGGGAVVTIRVPTRPVVEGPNDTPT